MKRQYLAIAAIFFMFSCGSGAEENSEEKSISLGENKEMTTAEVEEMTENHSVGEEMMEKEEISAIEDNAEVLKEEMISEGEEGMTEKEMMEKEEMMDDKSETVVESIKEEVKEVAPLRPDHEVWNDLTKKYVSSSGKVNYDGMKSNLSKITAYLKHLEDVSPKSDWGRNEKLAYWINLYNAATVHLVSSNYPISSITKINGGKPWDKKFVKSGGKTYTLNQIENEIVRPRFKDPRIHAALNCAAVSCPKILNGAFLPNKLNSQLERQTKAWINNPKNNTLAADKVELSKIFDWYKEDFKDGAIKFVNKYANIEISESATIAFNEYDWALNK